MNNLKDSRAFYIIISILIAVSLWFYVVNEVSTDTRDTIRNIPVAVVGQEELLDRRLIVTGQSFADLDLKIEGNRKSLMKLTKETVTITVDASKITAPGEYELRCNITLPNTISASSVTIKNRDNRVKLTVEETVSKSVELKGNFTGSLATGYRAEEFVISPSSLEISGPASLLETIAFARITLSGNNLSETYSGMLPVEFIDHEGERVTSPYLQCATTEAYAVYPIFLGKEVALKVHFIPGGGADEGDVTYAVNPERVQVFGPGNKVSELSEVVLGRIDLAQVGSTGRYSFFIQLPSGVKCESGETEATVTVSVNGLSTKTLEVEQIELINVPEGYQPELHTETLWVTVRGAQEAVEAVTAEQIKVIVDLSEFTAAGKYKAKVQLQMEAADDVGVLDEGKTVSVKLIELGE